MRPALLINTGLIAALAGGCATTTHPDDPFEPVNRRIYQFNEGVDKAIVAPTARAYRAVLPQFVRGSVTNFFSNLRDVRTGLNNTLQGKLTTAYSDFGRVAINSTLGMFGLFDVASEAGIDRTDPLAYAAASAVLLTVAVLAAWWPAHRATP